MSEEKSLTEELTESAAVFGGVARGLGSLAAAVAVDAFGKITAPFNYNPAGYAETVHKMKMKMYLSLKNDERNFDNLERDTIAEKCHHVEEMKVILDKVGFFKDEPVHHIRNAWNSLFKKLHIEEEPEENCDNHLAQLCEMLKQHLPSDRSRPVIQAFNKLSVRDKEAVGQYPEMALALAVQKFGNDSMTRDLKQLLDKHECTDSAEELKSEEITREDFSRRMKPSEDGPETSTQQRVSFFDAEAAAKNPRTGAGFDTSSEESDSKDEADFTRDVQNVISLADLNKKKGLSFITALHVTVPAWLVYLTCLFLLLAPVLSTPVSKNSTMTSRSETLQEDNVTIDFLEGRHSPPHTLKDTTTKPFERAIHLKQTQLNRPGATLQLRIARAYWQIPDYKEVQPTLAPEPERLIDNASVSSTTVPWSTEKPSIITKIVQEIRQTEMEVAYKILEVVLFLNCVGALFYRLYCVFLFVTRKCKSCVVTENFIHFNHKKEVYKVDRGGYIHTETGGGLMCMCQNNRAYTKFFTEILGVTQQTTGHVRVSFSIYKVAFLFFLHLEGVQARQFSNTAIDYVAVVLIITAITLSCGLYTDRWTFFVVPVIVLYFSSAMVESFIGDLLLLEKYARIIGSLLAILGLMVAIPIYALKKRRPSPDAIPVSRFKNYATMREKQPLIAHKFLKGKKWVTLTIISFVLLGFSIDTCLSEHMVCVNSKPAAVPCFHTETDMEFFYQPVDIQPTIEALQKLDDKYHDIINFKVPVWLVGENAPTVKWEMALVGWKTGRIFLRSSFGESSFESFTQPHEGVADVTLTAEDFFGPVQQPQYAQQLPSMAVCQSLPSNQSLCTIPELVEFWARRGSAEFHTKRFIYAYWSSVAKSCSTCVSLDDFTPWKTATQNSIESLIKSETLDEKAIERNTHALIQVMSVVNNLITARNYVPSRSYDFRNNYFNVIERIKEMIESTILQAQDKYQRAHTLLDGIRKDCDTNVAPKFVQGYVYNALNSHIESGRILVNGSVRLHLADGKIIIKYRTQPASCNKAQYYDSFYFEACIARPGDLGFVVVHDLYIEEVKNSSSVLITKVEDGFRETNDFIHVKSLTNAVKTEALSTHIRTYDVPVERLHSYFRPVLSGFLVLSDATYAFAGTHCLIGDKPPYNEMEEGEIQLLPGNSTNIALTCKDGKSFMHKAKNLTSPNETALVIPKTSFKFRSNSTSIQQIITDSPFNITAFNYSQSALEAAAGASLQLANTYLNTAKAQNFSTGDFPGFFDTVGGLINKTIGGTLKTIEGVTDFASSFLKSTFLGILPYLISGLALALSMLATLMACKKR